jgi:hypothetical protein
MKYKKLFLLSFLNPLGLILTMEYANAQNVNKVNENTITINNNVDNENNSVISQPISEIKTNNTNLNNNDNQLSLNKDKSETSDEFSLVPPFYTLSHDKNNLVAKTLNKKTETIYTEQ